MFRKSILLLSLIEGGNLFAGWTGSGGLLVNDANNPWWVQNTQTVNYCIQVDEANFGLTKPQLQKLIPEVFDFWKQNFHRVAAINFKVAQQNFVEQDCSDATDLRLQFGVLSKEQMAELKKTVEPTELVGITIRTDYDQKNMHAKGFIYLSPEQGSLMPNLPDVKPRMYSNPGAQSGVTVFKNVLAHELGHVFGLQHTQPKVLEGNDISLGVMDEAYPEWVISKGAFFYRDEIPLFFWPYPGDIPVNPEAVDCSTNNNLIFGNGDPAISLCLKYVLDSQYDRKFRVFGTTADQDAVNQPGPAPFTQIAEVSAEDFCLANTDAGLSIFVPMTQVVTPRPINARVVYDAYYCNYDGKGTSARVIFTKDNRQIIGNYRADKFNYDVAEGVQVTLSFSQGNGLVSIKGPRTFTSRVGQ